MKQLKKKKARKIILYIVVGILVVAACLAILYFSGFLVRVTDDYLNSLTEVPTYDLLQEQSARELEIKTDYDASPAKFSDPYIIVDPYNMNPLSALAIFELDEPGNIKVTVNGKDEFSTMTYVKTFKNKHCEVPILGLYAGKKNTVILTDKDGTTSTLAIETEALPDDFQKIDLISSQPVKMSEGITLFTAEYDSSYTCLVDSHGEIRGFFSDKGIGAGTSQIILSSGNVLSAGNELKQVAYTKTSIIEHNWLGKIFNEVEIEAGIHHSLFEMPDGNILISTSNVNNFTRDTTREDVIAILDLKTGKILKQFDFKNILDPKRDPFTHFTLDVKNIYCVDWAHINSASYNEDTNSILVSVAAQSMIVDIDADKGSINWIMSSPEGYEGTSAFLTKYLLKPIGKNLEWSWGQHDPMILPDQDGNKDTMDILVHDNGQCRSFYEKSAVSAENNYSRAVQYRINNVKKTVEQVWQYGKERGSECYSSYLGDADLLQNGNRLICFGGMLRMGDGSEKPVDSFLDSVLKDVNVVTRSRIIEVNKSGDVIFEAYVHESQNSPTAATYQAERIKLFEDAAYEYNLGDIKATRVGDAYQVEQTNEFTVPGIFLGTIEFTFNKVYIENNRLVIDGSILYGGTRYLLSASNFVFKSTTKQYVFAAANSLNGRALFSLNLNSLEKGTYAISILGGVLEGNDCASKDVKGGYIQTKYKITVK